MVKSDSQNKEIVRERKLRQSGDYSSVVSIPPVVREFTDFDVGTEVEVSAEVGGDEIRLQIVDGDNNEQPDN
ncbi:hypothetical protein [Aeromicrobium tamlense]|uniref:hypothetical protein n=1 Tax=Aeromicrobium tamlense TaxID=375541 RepID=UPI0031DE4D82